MAHWENKPIVGYTDIRCSQCKTVFEKQTGKWKFCPECGVSMQQDEPPTEKQLSYIKDIETVCDIKFTGDTKEEAKKFISANVREYKFRGFFNPNAYLND